MRPYYEDDAVTIYHGDCREVLPALDVDVACIVTDVPYAETSLEWDSWPVGWVAAVASTTPRRAPLWCFGSMRMWLRRHAEFEAAGYQFAQDVVWEKHNGSNGASDRFNRVHESCLQWYRGAWEDVWQEVPTTPDAVARQVHRKGRPQHWGEIGDSSYVTEDGGPRLQRSVIFARSCHGYATNETQKPTDILRPLVESSAPVGALVLDPFAGSGSTLDAARAAGRRAIGIELREEQCEHAARRLSQAVIDFGGAA